MARLVLSRGVTLVELLLAVGLGLAALAAALVVFVRVHDLFAAVGATAEAQHAARASLRLVARDLRNAGLGASPGDESFELVLPDAIVLRADLDADGPDAAVPEAGLAGGTHGSVRIGNDEISGYALARSGARGPDALAFHADVAQVPRDGVVEPVAVDRVVLGGSGGPFTLYRFVLSNDASRYGTPAFVVRAPVIDGVRAFSLRYYDASGREVDVSAVGGGETLPARLARASIRRVEVMLEVVSGSGSGRAVRVRQSVCLRSASWRGWPR